MSLVVCSTATQAVVELPTMTREVTLTSQQPESANAKPEITPVFVHPLKPEVRIREHTTARYVATGRHMELVTHSTETAAMLSFHSSPLHSLHYVERSLRFFGTIYCNTTEKNVSSCCCNNIIITSY